MNYKDLIDLGRSLDVRIGQEKPCTSLFGLYLRSERRKRNMGRDQFVDFLGASECNVGNWERGRSHPGDRMIRVLADKLDISVKELTEKVVTSHAYRMEYGEAGMQAIIDAQPKAYNYSATVRKLAEDPDYRGCVTNTHNKRGPRRKFVCSTTLPLDVARWYAKLAEREERSFCAVVSRRLVKYYEEQTGLVSTD